MPWAWGDGGEFKIVGWKGQNGAEWEGGGGGFGKRKIGENGDVGLVKDLSRVLFFSLLLLPVGILGWVAKKIGVFYE